MAYLSTKGKGQKKVGKGRSCETVRWLVVPEPRSKVVWPNCKLSGSLPSIPGWEPWSGRKGGDGCGGYRKKVLEKHSSQVSYTVRNTWQECLGLVFTKGFDHPHPKKSLWPVQGTVDVLGQFQRDAKYSFAWCCNACYGINRLCRGILGVVHTRQFTFIITSNKRFIFL